MRRAPCAVRRAPCAVRRHRMAQGCWDVLIMGATEIPFFPLISLIVCTYGNLWHLMAMVGLCMAFVDVFK